MSSERQRRLDKLYAEYGTLDGYDMQRYWADRYKEHPPLIAAGDLSRSLEENEQSMRGGLDVVAQVLADLSLPFRPRIVDLGTGAGRHLRLMRAMFPTGIVYGYDIAHKAMWDVQQLDVTRRTINVRDLDVVTCFDLVLHITNEDRFVYMMQENVQRVLKDGGFFVCTDSLDDKTASFYVRARTIERFISLLSSPTTHAAVVALPTYYRDKFIFAIQVTSLPESEQ